MKFIMILNGDIPVIKLWHSIRVYSSKIASGLKAQINKSNLLENENLKKSLIFSMTGMLVM